MASKKEKRLSLLGYRQNDMEMALACNHPNGVVLSIGDKRVELTRAQYLCLYDMFEQFIQSETEL